MQKQIKKWTVNSVVQTKESFTKADDEEFYDISSLSMVEILQ